MENVEKTNHTSSTRNPVVASPTPPSPSPGYEAQIKGDPDLTVDLNSVPVQVESVSFDGICRTKNDYVLQATQNVFKARNFGELILTIGEAQKQLKNLEAFSEIGTLVDTSKSPTASSDAYKVTFLVKELKWLNGGVRTMVGPNEGSVNVGIKIPNIFGRGEKLAIDHVLSSSAEKNSELGFTKPFPYSGSNFTTSVFYTRSPHTWSSFNSSSLGVLLGYNYKNSNLGSGQLQWQGAWRQLTAMGLKTSFPVREHFGNSIKSALRWIYCIDKRDQAIFPSAGYLVKSTMELAGLMGDAKYVKSELEFQRNLSIFQGIVLQGSLRLGTLTTFSSSPTSCIISDLFFLGGPQSLRGFAMRGVGPRSGMDALGGQSYWSSGLHLFAPLPYMSTRFALSDVLRTHAFLNAGSLSSDIFDQDFLKLRASCGLGIAFRLANVARIELNYCWPLRVSKEDRVVKGLQFGIGVDFI